MLYELKRYTDEFKTNLNFDCLKEVYYFEEIIKTTNAASLLDENLILVKNHLCKYILGIGWLANTQLANLSVEFIRQI